MKTRASVPEAPSSLDEARWIAAILRSALEDPSVDFRAAAQIAGQYRATVKRLTDWEAIETAPGTSGVSLLELENSVEWYCFLDDLWSHLADDWEASSALSQWSQKRQRQRENE